VAQLLAAGHASAEGRKAGSFGACATLGALDTENADAYAAAFTPDGQFGGGANAVKGREALKKMIGDFRQRAAENDSKSGEKRPATYHAIANSYLEFTDKDHARLEAYRRTKPGMVASGHWTASQKSQR